MSVTSQETTHNAQAARLHGIAIASMTMVKESLQLLSDISVKGFEVSVEADYDRII